MPARTELISETDGSVGIVKRVRSLLRRALGTVPIVPWLYDVKWVRGDYRKAFGTTPNLLFPATYNEKIAYRKLLDRRPIYNIICDKLAVKDYVRERLGEEGTVPETLRVYDDPAQFQADHVTQKCVLKSNAGWGDMSVLEPGDIDVQDVRRRIAKLLARGHGDVTREWGYYGIERKAFLEEYIPPEAGSRVPIDYKFHCFGGRVEMVSIMLDRFTDDFGRITADRDGNRLDLTFSKPSLDRELPISVQEFRRMVTVAERVSSDWDYIRVDLYYSSGTIYVGELTAYPAAGRARFEPETWDERFGRLWKEHRSLRTWTRSVFAETWGL